MQTQFISVGGNRHPHAADWNEHQKIVAFGANRAIAIWDPVVKLLYTLHGHQKLVTCVKFIDQQTLLSGSEDGTVRIWAFDNSTQRYVSIHTLNDHSNKSITCVTADRTGTLIVTGSADGSVVFYSVGQDMAVLGKATVTDRFYPLGVAAQVFSERFVAAVGGTSNSIFIFSGSMVGDSQITLDAKLEGHENWIRDIQFSNQAENNLLLASASQDRYIRLWRLHQGSIDAPRLANESIEEDVLTNKVHHINNNRHSITFEALILGHDDWVFSVSWHPTKLQLLSTSADSSANIWTPEELSGVWVCSARLGDISIKGASTATGASGGFWKGLWLYGGQSIATVGKTGSWRVWSAGPAGWTSQVGISGHFKDATDVCWSDDGTYFLSTSLDQTTRLYAEWKENGEWYEMARPQIHGYDMITIKSLNSYTFVSGGDEKIFRVFQEPKGIASLLTKLTGVAAPTSGVALPESAIVPALGLSNKQQSQDDEVNGESDNDDVVEENISSILSSLKQPPKEDHLQRLTLWPEQEKLYGHGYEVVSLDASPDKRILASCCKANNENHAVIRLYDIATWKQLANPLKLHSLTVTRLRFSPDNKYLLSVSRDRQWAVWERKSDGGEFSLHAHDPKGHSRIIWDCCWLPDSTGFVTGSRDKSFKLWRLKGGSWTCAKQVPLGSSAVTALDIDDRGQLIVGTEEGDLHIYSIAGDDVQLLKSLPKQDCPDQRIQRVCWRPNRLGEFAVASGDWSVRVYGDKI